MRMKYGPECDWNMAPTVKNTTNNLHIKRHMLQIHVQERFLAYTYRRTHDMQAMP